VQQKQNRTDQRLNPIIRGAPLHAFPLRPRGRRRRRLAADAAIVGAAIVDPVIADAAVADMVLADAVVSDMVIADAVITEMVIDRGDHLPVTHSHHWLRWCSHR
jgi:hypothetical protein